MFSRRCPLCGGKLQATGDSAPYPSHRCPTCIEANRVRQEIEDLKKQVAELQQGRQVNNGH